jgi:hypothetical protein
MVSFKRLVGGEEWQEQPQLAEHEKKGEKEEELVEEKSGGKSCLLYGPVDMETHRGEDGGLYVLDAARCCRTACTVVA